MADDKSFESHFTPHIDIIISDQTVPLSEIEEFSGDYGPRTGGDVRIVSRWGGPAAGGIGWGGPEIAVAILLGEMLRRASSDAYSLVRSFIIATYSKIRTRTGARLYIEGAMAVGVDSETKALRILFCFPEGLSSGELNDRLRLVEKNWSEVLSTFEEKAMELAEGTGARSVVKVCWNNEEQKWRSASQLPTNSEPTSRTLHPSPLHRPLAIVTRSTIR